MKMKKILGNLLLFITSLMCVIVLFGCVSINSKAARKVQPVKDLKLIDDRYHFKTVTDGFYFFFVCYENEDGKIKCLDRCTIGTLKKNKTIDSADLNLFYKYDKLGKIIFYVVGSDEEKNTFNRDEYLKTSEYAVSSYQTTVKERMPQPTGITTKIDEKDGKKCWVVSWADDGYGHVLRYSNEKDYYFTSSMNKKVKFRKIDWDVEEVTLKTSSCNLNKYANSEVVTIKRPTEDSDDETSKNIPADENANTKDKVDAVSKLPMTVTIDDITYDIDVNGNACATKIASKKKASLNVVTVDGTTYPVTSIAKNACKNNKKIKSVKIGSNVTSIGKNAFKGCKKLKKVTIKANKSLKIGKGAFKKINKDAKIKIKGVKGSKKKKLIKSISK